MELLERGGGVVGPGAGGIRNQPFGGVDIACLEVAAQDPSAARERTDLLTGPLPVNHDLLVGRGGDRSNKTAGGGGGGGAGVDAEGGGPGGPAGHVLARPDDP